MGVVGASIVQTACSMLGRNAICYRKSQMSGARVGVDVGGTFTDVILHEADGRVRVHKLLSTPPSYDRAVVEAVAGLAATRERGGVTEVVHGTTVATNAVLAAPRRRDRARHDARLPGRPRAAPAARSRTCTTSSGASRRRSSSAACASRCRSAWRRTARSWSRSTRPTCGRARGRGCGSSASTRSPSASSTPTSTPSTSSGSARSCAEELPEATVSLSSEILREQREYERTATTVVNAYVRPLMSSYIDRIRTGLDGIGLEDAPLSIMQSSGGVMTSDDAKLRPVFALESGPAAGRRRRARDGAAARDRERDRVRHGRHDRQGVADRARRDLARARVRGRRLDLGGQPADPRRGRAPPDPDDRHRRGRRRRRQHRLARPGGRPPGRAAQRGRRSRAGVLRARGRRADGDRRERRARLHARRARSPTARSRSGASSPRPPWSASPTPLGLSVLEAADGIHRIANARMTRALRSVSSEKGRDPRDFAIIAYGGSGPVHAGRPRRRSRRDDGRSCPPVAGLFSAVGLLFARPEFHEVRSCHLDVDAVDPRAIDGAPRRDGGGAACAPSPAVPSPSGRARPTSATAARAGRSRSSCPTGPVDRAAARRRCGRASRTSTSCSTASAASPARRSRCARCGSRRSAPPPRRRRSTSPTRSSASGTRRGRMWLDGVGEDVPVRSRASIGAEPEPGPLLVDEYDTTVVVPRRLGRATAPRDGDARARAGGRTVPELREARLASDPVTLQIVANALQSIADEMATTIIRTAHSTVVRDGMDFSSALCDARRRDGRPGGQRPVPPGLDPDRDGVAARPLRRSRPSRRRLHHERPLRRGHAPPGHLRRQARAPRGAR